MCSENHSLRTNEHAVPVNDIQSRSNTELLEEINKILDQGLDMDTEKLEQYLSILQDRAPVMADYNPKKAWAKLQADNPILFEEGQAASNTQSQRTSKDTPRRKTGIRKFLRVLEIAALLSLVLVVSANAVGFNPIKALLEWANEIVQVCNNPSGNMSLPPDDRSEYHTLEEALEADGLGENALPKWVPKDYSLCVVSTKTTDGVSKYSARYESDRGELAIIVAAYHSSLWAGTEEREDSSTVYMHDGIEFYLVTNYEQCKAGWQIDGASYTIRGQVTEGEMKQMIDSIE